jgi:DNA invertase Pin-like site-specific DNA recombinase
VQAYAKAAGIDIVEEFYDAAVSGADALSARAGFTSLLAYCAEHGVAMILVENASRFARDLMVQETGYAALKKAGISLVAVDSPHQFLDDTPTAALIRQVLGAVAEFDKAMTVSKLRGARDRASETAGKRVEGRKADAGLHAAVKALKAVEPALSLRAMASKLASQGFVSASGKSIGPSHISYVLSV